MTDINEPDPAPKPEETPPPPAGEVVVLDDDSDDEVTDTVDLDEGGGSSVGLLPGQLSGRTRNMIAMLQERQRGTITRHIIWLVGVVIVLSFWTVWFSNKDISSLIEKALTPLITLLVAIVGFYFGGKKD